MPRPQTKPQFKFLALFCVSSTPFCPFQWFNRKAEVEQEPQKGIHARNRESSALSRMAVIIGKSSTVGVTPGSVAAARGRMEFCAPGVCPVPPLWLWAQCSLVPLPVVRLLSHPFYSVALRAVGCCVLLCFRRSRAQGVLGRCRMCRCRLLRALFVCSGSVLLVRARGPALPLAVCLLGFPLLLALLHL